MAEQLQQERRGGAHARPGPPARPRPTTTPDGTPVVPLHRAPSSGKHGGTRTRGSQGSRTPWTIGLLLGAAALTAATVFWLQDLREPSRPEQAARPAATSLPDTGTDGGTTPSLDPVPSADPNAGTGALPISDRTALVQAATGPARDAAAARTALEQVLSARATATTTLVRAVVDGDLDAAVPAATAVDATSADVEAVVAAWRDPGTARQLRAAFDASTVASRAYATEVRADDEQAADAARAEMGATSRELGQMLEELTGGGITRFVPPEDAARLRDLVDAQSVGDRASADDIASWLTARMGREGVALATALTGPA